MEEQPQKKLLAIIFNKILTIPFNNYEQALLVSQVLNVDKELKGSGIQRLISTQENNLLVTIGGADYKKLRVTLNALLKNVLLIVKTIQSFSPE